MVGTEAEQTQYLSARKQKREGAKMPLFLAGIPQIS